MGTKKLSQKIKGKLPSRSKKSGASPDIATNVSPEKRQTETTKKVWQILVYTKDLLLKKSYLWAILLLAFLARMYRIGGIGANGQELQNIDRIFTMGDYRKWLGPDACTNLYYLLQNLWGKIFGFHSFNMRLFSVVLSLIGLYIFFKFTEEWFNRRLAYIATFLLSISSFHILVSRNISHEILYPVIILGSLHLLTLAYRYKIWQYFLLSGVLLGLGFYSSEITFVLIPVFIAAGVYFYSKNRKFFTTFFKEKIIFLAAAGICAAPFFYSVLTSPSGLFSNFTYKPSIWLGNAKDLISSIIYASPQDYMYNLGTDRIFDPLIEITFLLGLTYIVMRIKRRKFYFLVVWLCILVAAIIMKSSFSLGSFIYLTPIMFIMSGRILIYVIDKWFKTFPFNKFARIIMVLGIGFLFALSLSYNFQKVFLGWEKFPERRFIYNTQPTAAEIERQKTYLYKTPYSKSVLTSVMNIKESDIETLSDAKVIENDTKSNIITSPQEIFTLQSSVERKEFKGANIILLKGESK